MIIIIWLLLGIGSLTFLIYRYNRVCRICPELNILVFALTLLFLLVFYLLGSEIVLVPECAILLIVIYFLLILWRFFVCDKILFVAAIVTIVSFFKFDDEFYKEHYYSSGPLRLSLFVSLLAWLIFFEVVLRRIFSPKKEATDRKGSGGDDKSATQPVKFERGNDFEA